MDRQQIQILQQSFQLVEPIAETAAAIFYTRLFELDPSLRPLFTGDLKSQGIKLMSSLKLIVDALDKTEQIIPAVRSLGKRYAGYGLQHAHYATVGAALLYTLETSLGAAYTPEVKAAWISAYGLLSGIMQEAAAEANPVPPLTIHPGYA